MTILKTVLNFFFSFLVNWNIISYLFNADVYLPIFFMNQFNKNVVNVILVNMMKFTFKYIKMLSC